MKVKMRKTMRLNDLLSEMDLQVGDRSVFVDGVPVYKAENPVLQVGAKVEVIPFSVDPCVPF